MTSALHTDGTRVRFGLAGFVFTYRRGALAARVRIDMWREDPVSNERYWVTVASCSPDSRSARSVALALAAWVRSCDVGDKRDLKSQAVAESWAMLRERLARQSPEVQATVQARRVQSATRLALSPASNDNEIVSIARRGDGAAPCAVA